MKKTLIFFLFFFIIPFNVISSEITIVDINYILKNSNKGKLIQKELDNLRSKNNKNFDTKEKKLVEKEKKIASKKNILSQEDFNKEVLSFKAEVDKFNKEKRASIQELNKKKTNKIAKLLEEINNILVNYSEKNSISTIIDKKYVIITKIENDITNEILKILNK
tara:strand:- start:242 stop:733 length:492 start_codon:yes stop_codon:yes gene_type:complete